MRYRKPQFGTFPREKHPLRKGLVGCYLMNEPGGTGAGATVVDWSPSRNHGTIKGNMIRGVTDRGGVIWGTGLSGDSCTCGVPKNQSAEQLTVVARFILPFNAGTVSNIITQGGYYGTTYAFGMKAEDTSNRIRWSVHQNYKYVDSQWTVGAWATVGLVYHQNLRGDCFWDGLQVGTLNDNSDAIPLTQSLRLGNMVGEGLDSIKGKIAWAYLWNRALSDEEMFDVHDRPFDMFAPRVVSVGFLAAPSGGVTVTPTAASAAAATAGPTVVLGSVTTTPAAASAAGATENPTVVLGSVAVTPAAATAVGTTVDPTVQVGGDVTVTPGPASAVGATAGPTVVLGSVTVTPGSASAIGATANPTVRLGSVAITPTPAMAVAASSGPTVVHGSVSVTPVPAAAVGTVSSPGVVLGSTSVTPAPATAVASSANPTVRIGGLLSAFFYMQLLRRRC